MLTPKVLSLSLVSPAAGASMRQEFCFEGIPPNFVSAGACEFHSPSKDTAYRKCTQSSTWVHNESTSPQIMSSPCVHNRWLPRADSLYSVMLQWGPQHSRLSSKSSTSGLIFWGIDYGPYLQVSYVSQPPFYRQSVLSATDCPTAADEDNLRLPAKPCVMHISVKVKDTLIWSMRFHPPNTTCKV
jgi:hypothetical protein